MLCFVATKNRYFVMVVITFDDFLAQESCATGDEDFFVFYHKYKYGVIFEGIDPKGIGNISL